MKIRLLALLALSLPALAQLNESGCLQDSCISGADRLVFIRKGQYEIQREGKKLHSVTLTMKGNQIEKVFFVSSKTQFLLLSQWGNGETGTSRAEAFDLKMKRLWTLPVPGFNIGRPVHEKSSLYVGAIGFIGKIDTLKGKYVWKFDGLYDKYKFNGPDYINVSKDEARFTGGGTVLRVSQKTGVLSKL